MSTSHENTLFSDAETECDYDDSKTDISWLRKPKSKRLMDYSRNRNMKTYKSGKPSKKLPFREILQIITFSYIKTLLICIIT